jgi:hypothetical protein
VSGRIEPLTLKDVVHRSTSIVLATGLKPWSFRIDETLTGDLLPGESIDIRSHADWRAEEWERIRRERGVMKIMYHPSYEGSSRVGPEEAVGKQLLLFLSKLVLVADGAWEDPARAEDVRALL